MLSSSYNNTIFSYIATMDDLLLDIKHPEM